MQAEITIPAIAEDDSLYPIEKLEAHRRGVLHQAISVFAFYGRELLIQRRAAGKYHCGGLWANTCCSHPNWGESHDDCAARRLDEELGLTLPMSQVATIEYAADVGKGLREHERVAVYHAAAGTRDVALRPNRDEVSETRWETVDRLKLEAAARPEAFAPWFRIYLSRWDELGL